LRHNTEQLNWYEFLKDFGQVAQSCHVYGGRLQKSLQSLASKENKTAKEKVEE
jgi:hypothetical protein